MKLPVKRRASSFERRRAWAGLLFVSPFILGLILFFIKPLIDTVTYSFCTLQVNYETGFQTTFEGLRYYRQMFLQDPDFLLNMQTVLTDLLARVPTVIVFSVFAALLLNRQFRGRLFFRAVFFLPVVVMSGAVASLVRSDSTAMSMMGGSSGGVAALDMTVLNDLLSSTSLGSGFSNFLSTAVSSVVDISWVSGVQILLVLAGLQGISPSLYEAAKIEGASSWSEFWKITLPMCMPIIFLVVVYTILDSFTETDNAIIKMISDQAFSNFQYSYASAVAVVYSLAVLIIIVLVTLLIGRRYILDR